MIAPGDAAPFAAKVAPDGSKLIYSTLVTTGIASGMALTPNQEVILVGTANYNFPPTPNAFSSTVGTSFIAKLSADGTQLPYASYFSTPTGDTGGYITNVALDAAGDVWIGGNTGNSGSNVPMVHPLQSLPGNSIESGSAFVSEFDPQLHHLLFSTYFNGVLAGSRVNGLAIDTQGRAHVVGTGQDDLPTTPSAYLGSVTAPPAELHLRLRIRRSHRSEPSWSRYLLFWSAFRNHKRRFPATNDAHHHELWHGPTHHQQSSGIGHLFFVGSFQ